MTSADSSGSPQTVLGELQALVAKSIEANTRMIQNGSQLLRGAAKREVHVTQLSAHVRSLVRQAFSDYLRLSTAHTSRLIDLGVEISDSLVGLSTKEPDAATRGPLFDLKLSGRAGATCQSAFAVESDRPESVSTKFAYSLFIDARGEAAFDLPIEFEPPVLELKPKERCRVVVSLAIPGDLPAATYHTVVSAPELPGVSFRLLLEVEPAAPVATPAPSSASTLAPQARERESLTSSNGPPKPKRAARKKSL
jgi:hypothetical protein